MAREYKDSGIEWIGQIPKEWKIGKVKNFYSLQTGFTPDTKNELYYDENGALWVNISDIGNSHSINDTKKRISDLYLTQFKPKIVPKGSLLYSFKLSVGAVAIAGENLYTNEAIAAFLQKEGVNLAFLFYSSQVCIIFNANENIYGAKLLNQDLINNATIIFPPLPEQQKIADYLDKVCGEVDEMVALQETMIEELKAYKQSVITEAVTKGLNPNVPMKDSGIDWIGEIPEHWSKGRVKNYCRMISKGATPPTIDNEAYNGSVRFIKCENIYNNKLVNNSNYYISSDSNNSMKRSQLEENDILFVIAGATIGKTAIVPSAFLPSNTNQAVSFLRLHKKKYTRYLWYVLQSQIIQKPLWLNAVQSAQPNLSMEDLGNFDVPLPMEDEIDLIASYLDGKCSDIDSLIAVKQQKIEELKEYKKSIIYEYVTGKKEVI